MNLVMPAVSLLSIGAAICPLVVQSFVPTTSVVHVVGRPTASPASATRLRDTRPFGIMVQAEIEPDRMGEFMELIEQNAIKSRQEPGCVRFDVLRSDDSETTFFFYEVYQNPDAVEEHKKQGHYKKWAAFKESGGTISSRSFKLHGEFMT
jgi:(4S)-4-hydroxy-5-phosphonooxypentane-2,3-dione isomerase